MRMHLFYFLKRWMSVVVDFRMLAGLVNLPRYVWQYFKYKHLSADERIKFTDSYPCLSDSISHTPFDAHYYYQAAWLARCLIKEKPGLHIDIGSSVNMLSVLSAQQTIVFLDYRPLQSSLERLHCVAGAITALPFQDASICSLSSLHVLEHIGLGRYGDPLDPQGTRKACNEIKRVLSPGGRLYLSVPVGEERTCFNAHRVFRPGTIIDYLSDFELNEFSFVDDNANFYQNARPEEAEQLDYGCGMFLFSRE